MEILHFSDIIENIAFSSVYLFLSAFWIYFICIIRKRYTTFMHILLISILLTRSLAIFFLLTNYLNEAFPDLNVLWECIEGIIEFLNEAVLIACFYFVFVGFGCCSISARSFDYWILNMIFLPTYSFTILYIIYPVVGAAIYTLALPIIYLGFLRLMEQSFEYFRDNNSQEVLLGKIKLFFKVKTVIFMHTFISAIYYSCFALINIFNYSVDYLEISYKIIELLIILRLFYVVRPARNQIFTHDFIFQTKSTKIVGFLQALVPLGFNVPENKDNLLALLPRETLTFVIAVSIDS
ncbi:hypothetical protein SteCoe_28437 [Stentor coeruleus]|uniref:Uncharacterized protein n=1 Tax=Stentor coeruleus TaxID=5963 RepID=A0A1R2B8I5_9CILI|nr:hypothetical protein SteCoe_28437 [Stentor coeruleus]